MRTRSKMGTDVSNKLNRDQQIVGFRILNASLHHLQGDSERLLKLQEDLQKIIGEYDLRFRRESNDPLFVLMRGSERYRSVDRLDEIGGPAYQSCEGDIIVRHVQRLESLSRLSLEDSAALVQLSHNEVFSKSGKCPNCRATIYYSREFMKLPEWLYKQEFEAKHGRDSWKRYAR